MSQLLRGSPFGPRDDTTLLAEMNQLTAMHHAHCAAYAAIIGAWTPAVTLEELPWVHAGVFKHVPLRTDAPGIQHERILKSSATTGATPSQVVLDRASAALQSASGAAILGDMVGTDVRPLLVVDSEQSLRRRGEISARVSAAFSLKPYASEMVFALRHPDDPTDIHVPRVLEALSGRGRVLVYGFTWFLWEFFQAVARTPALSNAFRGVEVAFVHSGGWKRLEQARVPPGEFTRHLLGGAAPGSTVVDFYGLVEQNGVIFPQCSHGARHVARWAHVVVREPLRGTPLAPGKKGLLQLMNPLPHGAPYHNVLTEDVGMLLDGACACGRSGTRFMLEGRMPRAEVRGCANV